MGEIINGKAISDAMRKELKTEAEALIEKGVMPTLAVVLVGENPASQVYVRHKKKACEKVGIRSVSHEVSGEITEQALLSLIADLNNDKNIHGILVQLPLP